MELGCQEHAANPAPPQGDTYPHRGAPEIDNVSGFFGFSQSQDAGPDLVPVDIKKKFKHDKGTYIPGEHARFYLIGWRDTAKKLWQLEKLAKTFSQPSHFRRLFIAQPLWRQVAHELMSRTVSLFSTGWAEVYYAASNNGPQDLSSAPPPSCPSSPNFPLPCPLNCNHLSHSVEDLRDHIETHIGPEIPGQMSDRSGYCTRCAVGVRLITVSGRAFNQARPFLQLCSLCGALAPVLCVYSVEEQEWVPNLLISGTQVSALTATVRDCQQDTNRNARKHGGIEHRWFPKGENNGWIVDNFDYYGPREQETRTFAPLKEEPTVPVYASMLAASSRSDMGPQPLKYEFYPDVRRFHRPLEAQTPPLPVMGVTSVDRVDYPLSRVQLPPLNLLNPSHPRDGALDLVLN